MSLDGTQGRRASDSAAESPYRLLSVIRRWLLLGTDDRDAFASASARTAVEVTHEPCGPLRTHGEDSAYETDSVVHAGEPS